MGWETWRSCKNVMGWQHHNNNSPELEFEKFGHLIAVAYRFVYNSCCIECCGSLTFIYPDGQLQTMQPNQNSKIRILFLAANPRDLSSLRLGEEIRTIEERLRLSEFRNHFEIEQSHALRYSDITEALLRYKPDIVHFSGHGSSSGEIMLESEVGGTHPISPSILKQLFGLLKDNIRCVVLNACWSVHQAEAIATEIDCVVGMERAITDKGAIQFASGFYQGLAYGRDLETAFKLGRAQIDLSGLSDGAVPQLKAARGIKPKSIVFVTSGQPTSGFQQIPAAASRSVFIS